MISFGSNLYEKLKNVSSKPVENSIFLKICKFFKNCPIFYQIYKILKYKLNPNFKSMVPLFFEFQQKNFKTEFAINFFYIFIFF